MWVRAAGTGIDIHDAELQTTECAGQFCSAINRDLVARYGVDANLAAEKQLIVVAQGEGENAGVFTFPLGRSEEHTSELQSRRDLVCRLLLEKKKKKTITKTTK